MLLTPPPGSHWPDRDVAGPLQQVIARANLLIKRTVDRTYFGLPQPEAMRVIEIWNLHGQGAFLT